MAVNEGAKIGGTYTGYVIDANEAEGFNPIQVWIPSLNGGYLEGEFKAFGENTGSALKSSVITELKALCGNSSKFYRTMPTSMGSNGRYIKSLGANTMNSATWANYNRGSMITDVRKLKGYNRLSNVFDIGYGTGLFLRCSQPNGIMKNYLPSSSEGIQCETYPDSPEGTYSSITEGTMVLVTFTDSGNTGFVVAEIPLPSHSKLGIHWNSDKAPTN